MIWSNNINRVTLSRYVQDKDQLIQFDETGSQYIYTWRREGWLFARMQKNTLWIIQSISYNYAIANHKNVPEKWIKNKSTCKDFLKEVHS